MESRFSNTIEEITGRKVRAFLSQVGLDPDIAVEVFVLEPDRVDPAPEGVASALSRRLGVARPDAGELRVAGGARAIDSRLDPPKTAP